MVNHVCEACIVTCIDYRLQQYIDNWIKKNFKLGTFDRVALAGGVKNVGIILDQISASSRLHNIRKAVLINHEDCGAYGAENIPDKEAENLKHTRDLKNAASRIQGNFPELMVETYYMHMDGTFEQVI